MKSPDAVSALVADIVMRPGTAADLGDITAMLERAGLPTADLAESQPEFIVLTAADALIGVGGLEYFGETALLRSVVIASDRRSQGLGADLLAHLERRAIARSAIELVLLTQTAERFFARHGYARIVRTSVSATVSDSAEFRTLCPDSAICMSKRL